MQFIVSSRKMLELLQHCQVPDFIYVVVIDIQDTKRFLFKEFRLMKGDEFIFTVNTKKTEYYKLILYCGA